MTDRTIACLYFAWVREAVGVGEETVAVGPEARTVADLLNQLEASDPRYRRAFDDRDRLRFALDQQIVRIDASLEKARELAIFPPVTGG